ncbi:hypothetical protein J6590_104796 [Homalodisca vitripennis]|nr:hypothetical protein J6590_104796 [Homalodisca vitripennis]
MVSYNRPTTKPALLNRAVWLAWVDHSGPCVVRTILNRYSERRGDYLPGLTRLAKSPKYQEVLLERKIH